MSQPFNSSGSLASGSLASGLARSAGGELFAQLKVNGSNLWWAFSLGFVASLMVLAPSIYMLEVYDRVVQSRNHWTLLMLTLAVVLAYAVMELLEYLRSEILREAGHAMDEKLNPRLFALMFEANLRKHPGGTIQPLNDWRLVREFIHSPFVLAGMEAPASIVYLVIVYTINPVLGWFTLVGAGVQLSIAWLTERRTQQPLAAANRSAMAAQQYADGALQNAEVIQAMGMLRDIHVRWIKLQRRFLGQQSEASLAAGSLQAASKMVQQVLGSALLGLGAWLTLKNELNGGGAMMIVASIIGARVLAPLVQMIANWRQAVKQRLSSFDAELLLLLVAGGAAAQMVSTTINIIERKTDKRPFQPHMKMTGSVPSAAAASSTTHTVAASAAAISTPGLTWSTLAAPRAEDTSGRRTTTFSGRASRTAAPPASMPDRMSASWSGRPVQPQAPLRALYRAICMAPALAERAR
jgi:ABC-type multidrug transport system fused ATPase/permease subunit